MISYISNIIHSYTTLLHNCNKEYNKEYIWSGSLLYTYRSGYYCMYNYRSGQYSYIYNYKSLYTICYLPKNYLK